MPYDQQDQTGGLDFARIATRVQDEMGAALVRTVDETQIVATQWPKHRDDDPESVAVRWVGDRESQ